MVFGGDRCGETEKCIDSTLYQYWAVSVHCQVYNIDQALLLSQVIEQWSWQMCKHVMCFKLGLHSVSKTPRPGNMSDEYVDIS
jgi:hypothetical protein